MENDLFDLIVDCYIEVYGGVRPMSYQVDSIAKKIPEEIVLEAQRDGWTSDAIGRRMYEWMNNNNIEGDI